MGHWHNRHQLIWWLYLFISSACLSRNLHKTSSFEFWVDCNPVLQGCIRLEASKKRVIFCLCLMILLIDFLISPLQKKMVSTLAIPSSVRSCRLLPTIATIKIVYLLWFDKKRVPQGRGQNAFQKVSALKDFLSCYLYYWPISDSMSVPIQYEVNSGWEATREHCSINRLNEYHYKPVRYTSWLIKQSHQKMALSSERLVWKGFLISSCLALWNEAWQSFK